MKLTIMQMCRVRCRRLKRTNWRFGTAPLGIGALLVPIPVLVLVLILVRGSLKLRGEFCFGGAQLLTHLESPGQPEQRMSATNHECDHEQRGHAPEGVEQERIFSRVVVRGVREVSGEAAGRAGMALSTGGRYVCPAEMRAGVGDREHIVRSMAVITLCRFRVPELRNLPMIRIKIGLGDLLVAASAGSHHGQPETVLIRAVDGMGGVAIVANRKWLAVPAHALGMDAVLELLLDAMVAPAAGVGHVVGVDTRRRIGSGKNLVSGVATGASRGHGQAVLQ